MFFPDFSDSFSRCCRKSLQMTRRHVTWKTCVLNTLRMDPNLPFEKCALEVLRLRRKRRGNGRASAEDGDGLRNMPDTNSACW